VNTGKTLVAQGAGGVGWAMAVVAIADKAERVTVLRNAQRCRVPPDAVTPYIRHIMTAGLTADGCDNCRAIQYL
jgi:shikimate 5-dehydrogenase